MRNIGCVCWRLPECRDPPASFCLCIRGQFNQRGLGAIIYIEPELVRHQIAGFVREQLYILHFLLRLKRLFCVLSLGVSPLA